MYACMLRILVTFLPSRGYYPKGGGEIQVSARPVRELTPLTLTDVGSVSRITGRSFVAGTLPRKVA